MRGGDDVVGFFVVVLGGGQNTTGGRCPVVEPACEPTDGFVGHIDGRELGVVGFVGRGVGVATGFLLAEFPPQAEALGKVTLPFDAPAEGKFMGEDADGRDLEYFDALGEDAVGVGADTGARGFVIPLVGGPGVDGRSEGFDLLYFDGAVAEGVPLPEQPFARSFFGVSFGPFASNTPQHKSRNINSVIELSRNIAYSLSACV